MTEQTETEFETRLKALEEKIAEQKSWKDKHYVLDGMYRANLERLQGLQSENERLTKENATFIKLKEAFAELIPTSSIGAAVLVDSIGEINVNHKPVTVNIEHKGERTITLDTNNVDGRVIYVLVKESPPEGATMNEIVAKIHEHGWNTSQITAAAAASKLVKDGALIKTEKGYRLPQIAKFTIDGKEVSQNVE